MWLILTLLASGNCIARSVKCLTTDTADAGVASSILVRFNTFVDIDHERISTAFLLTAAGCQLQAKCAQSTG